MNGSYMHRPKVSVIVPGYNHAPYLRERIESILNQTMRNLEVILLDDCSEDESADILRRYAAMDSRVSHVVINNQNSGSTFRQWNKGLELASGEYVWIAESDDSTTPEFLETLCLQLDRHPNAVMTYCGSVMIDSEGREITDMDWDSFSRHKSKLPKDLTPKVFAGKDLAISRLLFTNSIYNASMVLFRRSSAPEIDRKMMTMRYCGDWLFWLRMIAAPGAQAVEIPLKLNRFRQHTQKVSPGASTDGRYFTEGLPVMIEMAEKLKLSSWLRRVMSGRVFKRLSKFKPYFEANKEFLFDALEKLSPGSVHHRQQRILTYELYKMFRHE